MSEKMSAKKAALIGAGAAVIYGFAKGKGIFNIPRFYNQHKAVENYLNTYHNGANHGDIIKTKDGFKSSKARRIGINIISFFIKLKTKKKIYDVTSGFRAINNNLMKEYVSYYPIEYPEPISTVDAIKKNYNIVEVPVVMKERKNGKSSISSWKNIYYMINVLLSIILMKGKK